MKSKSFYSKIALATLALPLLAQPLSTGVLSVAEAPKLVVKRGTPVNYTLKLQLRPGFHVNSNTPNDKSLIPLRLTWDTGAVEPGPITYPKPVQEKSEFSELPLSVYTGDFVIQTKFTRAATASPGPGYATGKLRYQACNDKMCLPPKTLEVRVPLLVE